MTRARERLVISSVEPYIANAGSWWERLSPLCPPMEVPSSVDPDPREGSAVDRFTLPELPALTTREGQGGASSKPPESESSRFGQAVHRLVEFCTPGCERFSAAQVRRVAREFALDEGKSAAAAAMAQRIVNGEAAWAWDASVVDWHGNEVPIQHAGEPLRIDRLVRRAGTGEWWVLDYKSNFQPEQQQELLEQMRRYRAAVSAANPGATVQAAFVTGEGKIVVVA
jgi:ATP-dependent helicase/nuclease subunit A